MTSTRFAVAALVSALLAGCGAAGSTMPTTFHDIEGVWLLESFSQGGEQESVQVGVNTAQQPWVEISADNMTGKAGCNHFDVYGNDTNAYTYDKGVLKLGETSTTATACFDEDGHDLMLAEGIFMEITWRHPEGINVQITGDEMIWRAGTTELNFRSTPAPPVRPPPPPATAFGPLDCSPGVVAEERIDYDGRTTEQILLDSVPEVAYTEQDPDFSPPAPSDWFWRGYDKDDTLIAFIARGDVEPPTYQVATCVYP